MLTKVERWTQVRDALAALEPDIEGYQDTSSIALIAGGVEFARIRVRDIRAAAREVRESETVNRQT